jgi:hypothetical protein
LDECGESKVNKPVLALFFIGRHSDEVLCDVILMHVCFLLGDIVMKFYVMSFLCMHVIYYWGGHDSLIGRLYMMGLEIGILL